MNMDIFNGNKVSFNIAKAEGDASVVPENRTFVVKFKDITDGNVSVNVDGAKVTNNGTLEVTVTAKADAEIEITVEDCTYLANADQKQELTRVISKFQMSTDRKGKMFNNFIKNGKPLKNIPKHFKEPIEEILRLK